MKDFEKTFCTEEEYNALTEEEKKEAINYFENFFNKPGYNSTESGSDYGNW